MFSAGECAFGIMSFVGMASIEHENNRCQAKQVLNQYIVYVLT